MCRKRKVKVRSGLEPETRKGVRADKVFSATNKDPNVRNVSRMAGNVGGMGTVGKRNPGPEVVEVIHSVCKETDHPRRF